MAPVVSLYYPFARFRMMLTPLTIEASVLLSIMATI